jgi:hypothetical protein
VTKVFLVEDFFAGGVSKSPANPALPWSPVCSIIGEAVR